MITTSKKAKEASTRKLICELIFSEFVIAKLEEHREKAVKASKIITTELYNRMPDATLIDEYISVRDKHEAAGTFGTEEFENAIAEKGRAILDKENISGIEVYLYGVKECSKL